MKIVFISNYFNNHQKYLSECFYKETNGNYYFIETQEMEEERKKMGWEIQNVPPYVIRSYISEEEMNRTIELINDSDAVIMGSAPYKFIKDRVKRNKITFRYSERFLKYGKAYFELPLRAIKYISEGGKNKCMYLLCASAYAAGDYNKIGCYKDRCFKWGYFPETPKFDDVKKIIDEKETASILWVGRLISWKHPDVPILVGKKLKECGYNFKIRIIGDGILKRDLENKIKEENLSDYIEMIGAISQNEVQNYMKKTQIFIATSDFNEGWGAVVNEAMGNACAVVASNEMGSVPFLIENEKNGFSFKNKNYNDLINKVMKLLDDNEERNRLSMEAYNTIQKEWNAKEAVRRFINLYNCICEKKIYDEFNGLCGKL